MNKDAFLNTVSKILNKKVYGLSNSKLVRIHNIDSLDLVKLIIGFKKYGLKLTISDIEASSINEILKNLERLA